MDKKEIDDIAAYDAEVEAFKSEYEATIAIMQKARLKSKTEYDAAKVALIEKEKAGAADQVRLTEEANEALSCIAVVAPMQPALGSPVPQNASQ